MKGKKTKTGSKKARKRAPKENVQASTSLPPEVEGQLRCYLRVSVTKIVWTVSNPPDIFHVRLRWWGELTNGTVYRPFDVKNPKKTSVRSIARFPIRCGPKQFAAYLNDMRTVIFEVLRGQTMAPMGKAQINEIGHLTPTTPINGFFTVFSNKNAEKIAELQVSLVFEPLPATYESSSSVPTTDVSMLPREGSRQAEASLVSNRKNVPKPEPSSYHNPASSDDPFSSPKTKTKVSGSRTGSSVHTPRGIDSDYSFVIGPGLVADHQRYSKDTASDVSKIDTKFAQYKSQQGKEHDVESSVSGTDRDKPLTVRLDPLNGAGSDIISSLLNRGTRLRNDMIQAELDSWNGQANTHSDYSDISRPRSGELLREILQVDQTDKRNQVDKHVRGQDMLILDPGEVNDLDPSELNDLETRTVELVLGDKVPHDKFKVLQRFQDGDDAVSLSSSSDDDMMSELGDPVHDDTILQELFYKQPGSSSSDDLSDLLSSDDEMPNQSINRSISIDDPGNIRPPSRKSSRISSRRGSLSQSSQPDTEREPKAGQRMRNVHNDDNDGSDNDDDDDDDDSRSLSARSEGSRVSFDDLVQEPTESQGSNVIEGLSVERLTLLGRVNVARVSVDHMTLDDVTSAQTTTPSRTPKGHKIKSRPPRPAQKSKRKRTYLVEYKFPVVATSRDGGAKVTTATEVMRLASKKVQESDVSFTHRSVFPVRFDETAVNRWWNHLLVFKVFARTAGQKTPDLLGVASVPLRSVLQSSGLCVQVDIPVRDKDQKQGTGRWSGSDEKLKDDDDKTVGHLQISVELASDSKDFMHDLTKVKVAEMKGSHVVALPSHKEPTQTIPIRQKQPDVKKQKEVNSGSNRDKQRKNKSMAKKRDPSTVSRRHLVQGQSIERAVEELRETQQQRAAEEPRETQQQEILMKEFRHGVAMDQQTSIRTQSELMTLHCLLHIPTGKGLTLHGIPPPSQHTKPHSHPLPHPGPGVGITGFGRDNITRNTYLVCRMFWSDDVVKSNVCWGTTEPNYDFIQIAPVLVTPSLLERTRNNYMIIEVWDKKTSAQNDQLVGIVKLPLHQFYMSFRDPRISNTLLRSKFPVVAVDSCLPIIDPFSGVKYGELKVLLSLGSQGQISEIQRVKLDRESSIPVPDRPEHFLERADGLTNGDANSGNNKMTEHVFEVIVEGIRGFPQFQDTVWGEADCFVQYHFPALVQQDQHSQDQPIKHAPPTLKPHRTATTLCIPDPMFHDICRHRLNIPSNTPVQRELLTACAGVGGGAGGIPFEVWCRYYYPNIRDQVLAKATLPLAKLCAMVTMQKRGETSVQSFSLPLRPQLQGDEADNAEQRAKVHDAGLLDITINYKTSIIKDQSSHHGLTKPLGSQVCIAVGILRACGLKAAAKSVARHDAGMQYPSDVGVNSYVKTVLSFLSKDEIRVTQTVARNFAPEFAHYVDFPCPLWFSEDSVVGGISLAEVLETSDVTFQVWHQVPGFKPDVDVKVFDTESVGKSVTARRLFTSSGDILLGSCTVPLRRLLTSKTGIKGWYPLYIPPLGWDNASEAIQPMQHQERKAAQGTHSPTERVGGGLEILISLAHQHDRERVIHAARSLGWAPEDSMHDVEECQKHDSDHVMMTSELDVHVDVAVLPLSCALRAGQTQLDKQAKAYIRYKFYDKAAVVSKLSYLDDQDDEYIQADLQHAHRFHCHSTEPFLWYLKEECLEIQLWISYSDTTASETRPRQRDRLIGCAYLDLSPLSRGFRDTQRISGMYPVFKPGAAHLGGAFLRVHISRKQMRQHQHDYIDGEGSIPDEDDNHITRERRRLWKEKREQKEEQDEEARIQKEEAARLQEIEEERQRIEEKERWKRRPVRVHVVVEQAMHITCKPGVDGLNTFYVSYQTTDGAVKSPSVSGCDRIIWGFEHEAKVNRDVLENQNLIFKIWQQTSEEPSTASDRVLGFVSVDLCPLLAGFKLINGWYNIMDFSGKCQGQLKIAISPLESISPLKQPIEPQQGTITPPKNKSTIFKSSSQYAEFPSHLVQYTEQTIQYQNPQSAGSADVDKDRKQNGRPQNHGASHFEHHLRNVRQFHETLQQRRSDLSGEGKSFSESRSQPHPHLGVFGSDTSSFMMNSKSFLRRNLRENLQQLDVIQENLRKKLERRDHAQFTVTSRVPLIVDDGQSNDRTNFELESDKNIGHISDDYSDDRLRDADEDYLGLERGRPERSPGDEIITENDAHLLTRHPIGGGGFMDSPTRHPIGGGRFMDSPTTHPVGAEMFMDVSVEPQIDTEFHRDPSKSFERDLEGIDTPPPDVEYGTMENIEDLLPARPPPTHWDPPRQESDSDWENSLDFSDIGSDVEEVIPRPLNDISSPGFSNGIIPDKSDNQFKNENDHADITNQMQQAVDQRQQSGLVSIHQGDDVNRKPEDVWQDVNQDISRRDSKEDDVAKEDPASVESDGQSLDRDSSFIVLSTDTRSQPDLMHTATMQTDIELDTDQTNIHQDHSNDHTSERPERNTEESTRDHRAKNDCKEMEGEVSDSDEDSVVITMDPKEALTQKYRFERKLEMEEKAKVSHPPVVVPNFFLPPDDLEASMKALRTAASVLPPRQQTSSVSAEHMASTSRQQPAQHYLSSRIAAVKQVADRLHGPRIQKDQQRPKTLSRPPTAEEAKRIARIFSAKYSTS